MSSRFRNPVNQDWGHNSGDDYHSQRKTQQPAKSANEALWRAAKRFGSAWRWLKIDLALLAEEKQHQELITSIETSLKLLGKSLLPDLGLRPVNNDVLEGPDVIDFVSILSAIPVSTEVSKQKDPQPQAHAEGLVQTNLRPKVPLHSKGTQTSGDFMVRDQSVQLSGSWVPLDDITTRRGALVRCTAPVTTDNAESSNLALQRGDVFKIVEIDSDGDFRVVVLEDAGFANLRFPSCRYWLLERECRGKVEAWLPDLAVSDLAASKRQSRKDTCESEHG